MKLLLHYSLAICSSAALLFTSCSSDDDNNSNSTSADPNAALKSEVKSTYADIVYYNYLDAYNTAKTLDTKIQAFVAAPTAQKLEDCKTAWLEAREPYGQTEAFRFASGPIDDEDGPEGLLNAWPLDEGFVDYVSGGVNSGIINDATNYPTLSKAILESLNEKDDVPENVSIGYHAIEFLLWGQDDPNPSNKLPGQRSYTDFLSTDGGTAANQDRRRDYLSNTSKLLLDHLQLMVDEWKPTTGTYRNSFLALPTNTALTQALTGIATLAKSELAGERIFTAYDNQDQEDEHSCFSDNTHRDIRLNWEGIKNVLVGCYIKTDGVSKITGPSIIDVLTVVDSELAEDLKTKMNETSVSIEATAIPFDFAISDATERPKVLTSVNDLQDFGDLLADAGTKLGLKINTALPD